MLLLYCKIVKNKILFSYLLHQILNGRRVFPGYPIAKSLSTTIDYMPECNLSEYDIYVFRNKCMYIGSLIIVERV